MGVTPMCFQWRQLTLPLVWHNRVPWLLHSKEVMATLCLFQSSNICHNYFFKYFLSEFTGGTQGLTPVPPNEEKRGTRFHIILHAMCCNRFWHTVISKTQEEVCIRLQAATRQSQYLHWDASANSRICYVLFSFVLNGRILQEFGRPETVVWKWVERVKTVRELTWGSCFLRRVEEANGNRRTTLRQVLGGHCKAAV